MQMHTDTDVNFSHHFSKGNHHKNKKKHLCLESHILSDVIFTLLNKKLSAHYCVDSDNLITMFQHS